MEEKTWYFDELDIVRSVQDDQPFVNHRGDVVYPAKKQKDLPELPDNPHILGY